MKSPFSIYKVNRKYVDISAFVVIFIILSIPSTPPLLSGNRVNFNDDFFQYAGRHEAVRKAILEHHTYPLRSYWFGGGYPTLGDPEDSSLNPLIIITIIFGSITGLKIIAFISIIISGLSAYALGRYVLGYTKWGSVFSGLIFGLSLFIPLRIQDGNPNEVYSAFLPLCMLLIGLACKGRKIALLILPFVFYTMISDGKYNALMAFLYIVILCLFDSIPLFSTYGVDDKRIKPLKIMITALIIAFLIGMARILPAIDLISSKGGLGRIELFFMPQTYEPGSVPAYTYQQLWQELLGWKDKIGLVTVGWLPVALSLISFYVFRKKSFPWGINLLLFGWLILAHNAPIDLLKLLWKLPVFNSLYRPYKYFSFEIVFTFAMVSGQFFWLLTKLQPKWLEHICAIALIILGVWFLYPEMAKIQLETYTYQMPEKLFVKQDEFYNIQGQNLVRNRKEPLCSITYVNLLRGTGTIDWHTGIPIDENAIPKYFVDASCNYIPNPRYKGEVYFMNPQNLASVDFHPNSINIQVDMKTPDTLVINQNYHSGWHANRGRLTNRDGLLALELDKAEPYNIGLYYVPLSFCSGLAISVLTIFLIAFVCWSYRSGRLLIWSNSTSHVIKILSRLILWLLN